jgi:hypothetical protein
MAVTSSSVVVVAGELSPAEVTQLTQRQFPHAGVPEIVNCRSASYVTSGIFKKLHACQCPFLANLCTLAPAIVCTQIRDAAAWLQGNAQVTISGTPA